MATETGASKRKKTQIIPRKTVAGGLRIEIDREADGRWIADVVDLPGVMVYGENRSSAIEKAKKLAIEVLEERKQRGERVPEAVFIEE